MIRFVLTIMIACAATALGADRRDVAGYYVGTIDGRLAVTMSLSSKPAEFCGRYRYVRHGEPIYLQYETKPGADIRLAEAGTQREENTPGGHFRGRLDDAGNFTGVWTSADGTKALPFALRQVATEAEYSTSEPRYRIETSIPNFTSTTPFYTAINDELKREARKSTQMMTAEYREDTKDPDSGPFPYESGSTTEVLSADDTMVSLLYQNYDYSGGAHGNYGYAAVTFLWRHNKLIGLRPSDMLARAILHRNSLIWCSPI